MRRYRTRQLILLLPLVTLCLFSGCSDDEDATAMFTLGQEELTVGADGAQETLELTANTPWTASANEPWLTVSPASGTGSAKLTVKVDSTLISDMRAATVRFNANGVGVTTLTVRQTGYGCVIHCDSVSVAVVASLRNRDERYFTLPVTTNTLLDVEVMHADGGGPDWLSAEDTEITLDRGARPRTTLLRFDWTNNTSFGERSAKIMLTARDGSQSLAIDVTQAAAPTIEDNAKGDSMAIVTIATSLDLYSEWDLNEPMRNWDNVTLWEKGDKDLPCDEAVGRVRSVQFMLANTDEQLPPQVKYLKYAESLSFFSNVNAFIKTVELGDDVCELKHLKSLEVFAWGMTDLPQSLVNLSPTLEELYLGGNNFTHIPEVLTKENFPHLRVLKLQACRRWTCGDLRNANNSERYEGGIGMHFNTATNDDLRRLLLWDTLEQLVLSYNYMEGQVPDFKVGEDGVEAWTQEDVANWGGDTIQWLVGKPKILPGCKQLTLNLNFFTGNAPEWLLYHPRLLDWVPEQLIFNQMEEGLNSEGKPVRFDNEPTNFEYYYQAFPLFRTKYEYEETIE